MVMEVCSRRRKESAVTLLEVLVVVTVLVLLVGMLSPFRHSGSRPKFDRIKCANNLKNIGLAFGIFCSDNAGQFPWKISGTTGTKDLLVDPSLGWQHFSIISNELSTPIILLCPADHERRLAGNFASFGPSNLSYFLGVSAALTIPQSILAGDRNLTTNGVEVGPGLLQLSSKMNAGLSAKIHVNAGHVLIADGSVQYVTGGRLQKAIASAAAATTNAGTQLLIP